MPTPSRRLLLTSSRNSISSGEFTIHKEFVSSKVSGETASLTNPALDRILDFAAEVGLVVLIHNDVDMPFPKEGAEPVYLAQMKSLLKRHPNVPIIWAHCGMGRVVRPVKQHAAMLESILSDPGMHNVYFDISWDEVAKYIVASPESVRILPISSIAIRNAFCLEPTKLPRQIRKSIFESTTNTSHCGTHSLPRQAKMLGKEITNGSLMKRGRKFAPGKRLIQKATEQLQSLMGQLRNCLKHW